MSFIHRAATRDRSFTRSDAGKPVITADDEVVGTISRIEDGEAYVTPTTGLLDGLGSPLSNEWSDASPFALDREAVAAIVDDAVVLKPAD